VRAYAQIEGIEIGDLNIMTRAIVFPGQGSQFIGMGKPLAEAFAAARDVFHEVDETLKQPLSRLMWTGSEDELKLTENAQPALMAVSVAVARVLEHQGGFAWGRHASFIAGHSLGEYSALTAAGAFALSDAARLLRRRGEAMQRAVPLGVGAMAIPLGAEIDVAEAIAKEASTAKEICEVANDNAPGQIVLSGHKAAIERVTDIAKAKGVRRVLPVAVSAPFHCSLMAPAAREMEELLGGAKIAPPKVPLIANVTAEPTSDPETIRRLLVQQITGRVRWREIVLGLRGRGVTTMVEMGAGKVLAAQAKRTDAELVLVNVETPQDVEAFLRGL
jgi:[acyl-carrier-protein] S-malonyltransferase